MKYTSSLINNYGHAGMVKKDAKVLNEILSRQGMSFVIDCLSEHVGMIALKWKADASEFLVDSLVKEFKSALKERT